MSERQALRRHFRALRRGLSRDNQKQHALAVTCALSTSAELLRARRIGLYWAADGELDLGRLAKKLSARGKALALPAVSNNGDMSFYRYRPGDALVTNRFNIPEPAPAAGFINGRSLDLLLIPLVAFDAKGNRLGMGAGYYDRYLAKLGPALRPRIIGVAHGVQRSDEPLPVEPWDVPLDQVITEAGWQLQD